MKRKDARAAARRSGADPRVFESLAHLHDTLTLPSPAVPRSRLSEQIFDLHQQLNRTREDATTAAMLGLPTERLSREIIWGEQCLDVLLEIWADPDAESA